MRLLTTPRYPSTFLALAALSAIATTASADLVLTNNTIQGTVRFDNATQPGATAAMNALLAQLGFSAAALRADSTSTPIAYTSTTAATITTPTEGTYQLSAESDAAGLGGIAYTVTANAALYTAAPYTATGTYRFRPATGVLLQPQSQQPGGATANLEECVGLVHLTWWGGADCDVPAQVEQGWIDTTYSNSSFSNTHEHYVLQLGGTSEQKTLYTRVGIDESVDALTFATTVDLHPPCNQIQDVPICVPSDGSGGSGGGGGGGGGQLGELAGPFNVIGEAELQTTFIDAFAGPNTNRRYGFFTPAPPDLDTPWSLKKMMPGDYRANARVRLRTGRAAHLIVTPQLGPGNVFGPATVVAGTISDLQRNIAGQNRYPFVMTPAFFKGAITLADPHVVANPAAYSSLSALYFLPTPPTINPAANGTSLLAEDIQAGGSSVTSFDGAFDPATGLLTSSYEQVLVSPYDLPLAWKQSNLRLRFEDPAQHRSGNLYLNRDPAAHTFSPQDVVDIDHAYCFNEIVMGYSTNAGTLFDPTVAVTGGGFNGVDWQSHAMSYTVTGGFGGIPQGVAAAALTGEVRFTLPQGTYNLQPSAGILSAAGGTSTASFQPTGLTVGCGQRITVIPGLSVAADLPPCALEHEVALTGSVDSGGDPVDHVWVVVNGSPPIDICNSDCDPDHQFIANVPLTPCSNTIEVFASAGGNLVSVTTQTVWDDPTDGIICGDGACSQGPEPDPDPDPVKCADVKPQVIACGGGDQGSTGDYTLTLAITNNTATPIVHVLLPDAHLSPHSITLPVALLPGASTTIDVTVSTVNPGAKQCFMIGFGDKNHDECCSQKVCVEIPSCCFEVDEPKATCLPGDPNGAFTYGFTMVNHTTDAIEHVFLFPPPGITVSPDYLDISAMPPGGATFIGPITITGALPGQKLCLEVGIHDEEMNECCAEQICLTAPPLCEETPEEDHTPKEKSAAPPACALTPRAADAPAPYGTALLLSLAALAAATRRRPRPTRH